MNRPKNIGTAVETAVTRYAQGYGFPYAERRALSGSLDRGDINLCPGVIVETKGGAQAETASDALIRAWLKETDRQRVNANAAVGVLVTKRRMIGHSRAGDWSAWLTLRDLHALGWTPLALPGLPNGAGRFAHLTTPIRLTWHDALTMLRAAGYGAPLEEGA